MSYILQLLEAARLEDEDPNNAPAGGEKTRKAALDMLSSEPSLRSKRELIEKFIDAHMPSTPPGQTVQEAFGAFWTEERRAAFDKLCSDENLKSESVSEIIQEYQFSDRPPLPDDLHAALNTKPGILERRNVLDRVKEKILDFVRTFDDGTGEI